jgi:hypothetical protein
MGVCNSLSALVNLFSAPSTAKLTAVDSALVFRAMSSDPDNLALASVAACIASFQFLVKEAALPYRLYKVHIRAMGA